MNVKEIRRQYLSMWLKSVRLPLTVTETFVRRDDSESWPPAIAFASFEGTMKDMVGRMTHDDTLVEMAQLQRAEITQRRRAAELHVEAASTAAETRRDAEEDQARLEQRRAAAEERRREAARKVEADSANAKQAVERAAATKRTASKAAAATRAKTIDKTATKAEAERLRKEAQALRAKKQAVAATADVIDLDKAVQAKKTTRRRAN